MKYETQVIRDTSHVKSESVEDVELGQRDNETKVHASNLHDYNCSDPDSIANRICTETEVNRANLFECELYTIKHVSQKIT